MNHINRNKLARAVTLEEGLKVSVSIAQVKEVQRILLNRLADEDPIDVLILLRNVRNKK